MKTLLVLLFTFSFIQSVYSFKNDLTSICTRPGTSEMYIGGEFKTILVVDKKTGSELRRLTHGKGARDMQFSPDGKKLIVFDGQRALLLDPETGEQIYSVKASNVRLFENAPYFIDADWNFTKSIIVYSTDDGAQVFKYTPSFTPLDAGFDPDFKELIILGRGMEITGEKDLVQERVEAVEGYNVYNKAYVEQQDDNKGSGFEVIDMETKTSKLKVEIPYKTANSFGLSISKFGTDYYLSCWDMLLRIDAEGKAYPISYLDARYAYATNAILKGKYVVVSSTKEGYIYKCESKRFVDFDARDENEFAYSRDITDDGELIYMLNGDFTVSVLDEKARVVKRFKLDNATGNGFGVYYHNAYIKKEDRDKEAAIINGVLKSLDMPTVDLETHVGEDFLIGTFATIKQAEAFRKQLAGKGLDYITTMAPME